MTRGPRLLPLVAFAALCLVGLKLAGLMFGGGYVLSGVAPATAQSGSSPASAQSAPAPAEAPSEPKAEAKPAVAAAQPDAPAQAEEPVAAAVTGPMAGTTKSEMDVLESLALRRKALDQREREMLLRENLLKVAEDKVEARISELKAIEARIESELKRQDEERKAQHDRLVQMYTAMKPKDAATIFNRMNLEVLTALASEMSPRAVSAILAEMEPAMAQRLTQELASRSPKPDTAQGKAELPKIVGRGPS